MTQYVCDACKKIVDAKELNTVLSIEKETKDTIVTCKTWKMNHDLCFECIDKVINFINANKK